MILLFDVAGGDQFDVPLHNGPFQLQDFRWRIPALFLKLRIQALPGLPFGSGRIIWA
jgi:hypothetical protein